MHVQWGPIILGLDVTDSETSCSNFADDHVEDLIEDLVDWGRYQQN